LFGGSVAYCATSKLNCIINQESVWALMPFTYYWASTKVGVGK